MVICFWINFGYLDIPAGELAYGCFVPYVPPGGWLTLVGLVGAVLMPHNLFLGSSLVLADPEIAIDRKDYLSIRKALKCFWIETGLSLLISIFINIAVIAAFAKFYGTG